MPSLFSAINNTRVLTQIMGKLLRKQDLCKQLDPLPLPHPSLVSATIKRANTEIAIQVACHPCKNVVHL